MNTNENFYIGLLFITYLLMDSDHEIDAKELHFLDSVRLEAGVSDAAFKTFCNSVIGRKDREIYQIGMNAISQCSEEEKIKIFVKLYQMAMADQVLRPKEVRLILYATRMADVDMNKVVESAKEAV